MDDNNKGNLIAEYGIIQGAINASSQFIIQVFGFSIAAIVALIIASVQAKNILLLIGVPIVVLVSYSYISYQTRLIIETETYIIAFIETKLTNFKWKQRLFNLYKIRRENNIKLLFIRLFSSFSEVAAFGYGMTLLATSIFLLKSEIFNVGKLRYVLSLFFTLIALLVVRKSTEYAKEDYYSESIKNWKKWEEQEQLGNLDKLLSLEPSRAKLVESNGEEVPIPEYAYQVLRQVIQLMASGQAVSVVPQEREMTTQEAADLLNVSQPFLVKLLDEGKIPYIKVGSHRRIRFQDLMTYKKQRDTKRSKLVDNLIQMSQDEGFYEDEKG